MTLYIENPKDASKKKLLELINEFSKVEGYKTNMEKSAVLLYTNNKLPGRETKKIQFIIASKRIKYLRINLTKEVKELYSENYKTLMKETEDCTNEGKLYHAHVWEGVYC